MELGASSIGLLAKVETLREGGVAGVPESGATGAIGAWEAGAPGRNASQHHSYQTVSACQLSAAGDNQSGCLPLFLSVRRHM